jgi:50S ribosomal subunit-associated GTPase HflX
MRTVNIFSPAVRTLEAVTHALQIRQCTNRSMVTWQQRNEIAARLFASRPTIATMSSTRERPTRFRILIVGRANAGKTTILKKLCDADEGAMFLDANHVRVKQRSPPETIP